MYIYTSHTRQHSHFQLCHSQHFMKDALVSRCLGIRFHRVLVPDWRVGKLFLIL